MAEAEEQQGERKQARALRESLRRPLALQQRPTVGPASPTVIIMTARPARRPGSTDRSPAHPRPQNGQHVETRAPADDLAKGEAGDQAQTGRETHGCRALKNR